MKNLLLLFSILLIVPTAYSQSRPPKKIRQAFEQHAPQAKAVSWSVEGERYKDWTAKYMVGVDSLQTKYGPKASWLYTFKYITLDKVPDNVMATISDDYQGATLRVAAEMQEPDFDGYAVAFIYLEDRWVVALTKEGKVFRRRITSEGF